MHFKYKYMYKFKENVWKKIYYGNTNHKRLIYHINIREKIIDQRILPEVKMFLYNDKRSINEEVITILKIYVHNRSSKYIEEK